nr:MAG TPA: hypothetical protein [Caudoviricetes sp.]DAZ44598.1 MAG TPA: hypothetical protein [Caudoviricetes sp.]
MLDNVALAAFCYEVRYTSSSFLECRTSSSVSVIIR